jgi:hypothetical protein
MPICDAVGTSIQLKGGVEVDQKSRAAVPPCIFREGVEHVF